MVFTIGIIMREMKYVVVFSEEQGEQLFIFPKNRVASLEHSGQGNNEQILFI